MENNSEFIDSNDKIQVTKHSFNKKRRNIDSSLRLGKTISEIFDDFLAGEHWDTLLTRRTKYMTPEEKTDYISVAYEVCDSLHSLFDRRFDKNPEKYSGFIQQIKPKTLFHEDFGFDSRDLEHLTNIIYPDMPFMPNANFYFQGENLQDKFFRKRKNEKPKLYCRPRTISRIIEQIYNHRI